MFFVLYYLIWAAARETIVPFTTVYTSLLSQKSDLSIGYPKLLLLTEYCTF